MTYAQYTILYTRYASRNTQYAIRNTSNRLYTCRELSTNRGFYAKQTQSQERSNQRKLFYNNKLCESGHLVKSEKQTQNKPNPGHIEFTLSVTEGNGPILSAAGGFRLSLYF
jgi:hypothetical protein